MATSSSPAGTPRRAPRWLWPLAAGLAVLGLLLTILGVLGLAQRSKPVMTGFSNGQQVQVSEDGMSVWSRSADAHTRTVCTANGITLLRPTQSFEVDVEGTPYYEVARSPEDLPAATYAVSCDGTEGMFVGPAAPRTVAPGLVGQGGLVSGLLLLGAGLAAALTAFLLGRQGRSIVRPSTPSPAPQPQAAPVGPYAPGQLPGAGLAATGYPAPHPAPPAGVVQQPVPQAQQDAPRYEEQQASPVQPQARPSGLGFPVGGQHGQEPAPWATPGATTEAATQPAPGSAGPGPVEPPAQQSATTSQASPGQAPPPQPQPPYPYPGYAYPPQGSPVPGYPQQPYPAQAPWGAPQAPGYPQQGPWGAPPQGYPAQPYVPHGYPYPGQPQPWRWGPPPGFVEQPGQPAPFPAQPGGLAPDQPDGRPTVRPGQQDGPAPEGEAVPHGPSAPGGSTEGDEGGPDIRPDLLPPR